MKRNEKPYGESIKTDTYHVRLDRDGYLITVSRSRIVNTMLRTFDYKINAISRELAVRQAQQIHRDILTATSALLTDDLRTLSVLKAAYRVPTRRYRQRARSATNSLYCMADNSQFASLERLVRAGKAIVTGYKRRKKNGAIYGQWFEWVPDETESDYTLTDEDRFDEYEDESYEVDLKPARFSQPGDADWSDDEQDNYADLFDTDGSFYNGKRKVKTSYRPA